MDIETGQFVITTHNHTHDILAEYRKDGNVITAYSLNSENIKNLIHQLGLPYTSEKVRNLVIRNINKLKEATMYLKITNGMDFKELRHFLIWTDGVNLEEIAREVHICGFCGNIIDNECFCTEGDIKYHCDCYKNMNWEEL